MIFRQMYDSVSGTYSYLLASRRGGRAVLVTLVEGRYFAFTKDCPHEGADLNAGGQLLAGAKIRCNNHGYCFDLRSGACLVPQGGAPLTVLPVEERGEEVCIKLEW